MRRLIHDNAQILVAVKLEPVNDSESAAQRRREQSGPRCGADQGEFGQRHLDAPRPGSLSDDDVDVEILHGRIEDLLDGRVQPVDFIDEQNVVRLEICEIGGQISPFFYDRTAGRAYADLHFVGNDGRQRCFAQSRRAVEQHVVERFLSFDRGLDADLDVVFYLLLPDVLAQSLRPKALLEGFFFRINRRIQQRWCNSCFAISVYCLNRLIAAKYCAKHLQTCVRIPPNEVPWRALFPPKREDSQDW